MKYMGSKARVAKDISPIINKLIQENGITTYIEPFVGGSNMIEHIQCENKFGYDNNEYLVEFWKQIQQGWNPLPVDDEDADMTKELYQEIKDNKEKYPKHIVALAGFCATYNAKWFGGYAGIVKTKIGTFRNYYHEAVRNVLNQAERIKDVHYECIDYKNIDVHGALIYCDPPYQGTTKYKDDFDHEQYWNWVRKMSEKNIVLCSEYAAPDDFDCIWSKELTTTLDKNSRSKSVEKLFALKKEKENKKMELKMNEYQLPEQILFNYEELKKELTEKVSMYETMVYTDEQIQDAKKDKANLNKLKKALNDERIRREKEYMQPFNDFKAKINEIISIIDKPVAVIDKQVKEFEEKQKQEKLDRITEFYNSTEHPEWLHISQVMNEKWLNASTSMKSVQDAINAGLEKVKTDLETLSNLPEFGFEASEVYKNTLDITKAIAEAQRMSEIAKTKAEQERLNAEAESKKKEEELAKAMNPPVVPETIQNAEPNTDLIEPAKQWIGFQALLSTDDALLLKKFFESRNIQFKAV